ncbi:MAG: peptidase M3, partial [Flavobacterium sp.]
MKKTALLLAMIGTSLTSCNRMNTSATIGDNNPLLATFETPYQAPPFDLIKNDHYKPAILEGIRVHQGEIDAIAAGKDVPTFENTIVALENSGTLLNRVNTIFNNITSANTNDTLQALAQELAPEL